MENGFVGLKMEKRVKMYIQLVDKVIVEKHGQKQNSKKKTRKKCSIFNERKKISRIISYIKHHRKTQERQIK